jgi:7-carboxy-7-deazaguanine synthase
MLTVNEIFHSIQGESTYMGEPCVFVRLTACDLRCSWCDTPYAFYEGRKRDLEDVMTEVESFECPLVEITGGEPLLQEDVYPLMERLLGAGHTVLLETGGHLDIGKVPSGVVKIVDIKCPGSGEADRQDWGNIGRLLPHDQVKFVIQDETDYQYAREVLCRHQLDTRCSAVLLSPVHGVLDPKILSAWVLRDRLPARVQLQVHKYIWGPHVRGV